MGVVPEWPRQQQASSAHGHCLVSLAAAAVAAEAVAAVAAAARLEPCHHQGHPACYHAEPAAHAQPAEPAGHAAASWAGVCEQRVCYSSTEPVLLHRTPLGLGLWSVGAFLQHADDSMVSTLSQQGPHTAVSKKNLKRR